MAKEKSALRYWRILFRELLREGSSTENLFRCIRRRGRERDKAMQTFLFERNWFGKVMECTFRLNTKDNFNGKAR